MGLTKKEVNAMNMTIEQALGHAMLDSTFQNELFSNPEKVGKEIGLSQEDINLLKSMDALDFSEFREKLNTQLEKLPIVPIFCAVY